MNTVVIGYRFTGVSFGEPISYGRYLFNLYDLAALISNDNHVNSVRVSRIIPEIAYAVVRRVAVVMTDLHTSWAWAEESLGYKSMDAVMFSGGPPKFYFQVPTDFLLLRLQNSPRHGYSGDAVAENIPSLHDPGQAFHPPQVGDLIPAFISGDVSPDFLHQSRQEPACSTRSAKSSSAL